MPFYFNTFSWFSEYRVFDVLSRKSFHICIQDNDHFGLCLVVTIVQRVSRFFITLPSLSHKQSLGSCMAERSGLGGQKTVKQMLPLSSMSTTLSSSSLFVADKDAAIISYIGIGCHWSV